MIHRMSVLLWGAVHIGMAFGQHDAQHRLDIMTAVERSNSYFNSCMDREGFQRVGAWEGFEALFGANPTLVNDVLVLNQMGTQLGIDLSIDPIAKLTPPEIQVSHLDYLQTWRHIYSELPTFDLVVHHVDLDRSKTSARCWVSKAMIAPGQLQGSENLRMGELAEHIQQVYPLKMIYSLVRDESGWMIRDVSWSEGQNVPWQQFIKITDGDGTIADGWNMNHWNWSESAKYASDVMEVDAGIYHVLSESPDISLSYADPSFEGQKNCATAQPISVEGWLRTAQEGQINGLTEMRFSPATLRLEGQWIQSPGAIYAATNGVGECTQFGSQGVQLGIWKSSDKDPNSNRGWRIDISGGETSGVWENDAYLFEEDAMDEDGDEYLRRTQFSSVHQAFRNSWTSIGVGYERSNRSEFKPELWTGWRARLSAGAIIPRSSTVEYQSQISGSYRQYGNVELTNGVYDFGSYEVSSTTSNEASLLWSVEMLSVLRIESKAVTGLALTGCAGLAVQGAIQRAEGLSSYLVPNLMATSASSVNVLPVIKLGVSKLLIPTFDSNCID